MAGAFQSVAFQRIAYQQGPTVLASIQVQVITGIATIEIDTGRDDIVISTVAPINIETDVVR